MSASNTDVINRFAANAPLELVEIELELDTEEDELLEDDWLELVLSEDEADDSDELELGISIYPKLSSLHLRS